MNILHEFSSNRFERIDTEGTIFIGFTRDISLRGIRFREHSKENVILSSNSEILSQKWAGFANKCSLNKVVFLAGITPTDAFYWNFSIWIIITIIVTYSDLKKKEVNIRIEFFFKILTSLLIWMNVLLKYQDILSFVSFWPSFMELWTKFYFIFTFVLSVKVVNAWNSQIICHKKMHFCY